MTRKDDDAKIIKAEVPIAPELADELVTFWEATFDISYQGFRRVLSGGEVRQNRNVIYLARVGSQLVGTCQLTLGRSSPRLAGFGEVAVAVAFRRRGIATDLCSRARGDFQASGGEALFLGTVNAEAARVYRRLGWRKISGTHVMVFISGGDAPEKFLENYFDRSRPCKIVSRTAADRIPMIPLVVTPHDGQVLDGNVRVFSTRHAIQQSCMSLYPRYEALAGEGRGTNFSAWSDDGRLVGLATAVLDGTGHGQVDGFAHHNFVAVCGDLLERATRWCDDQGAGGCGAIVSVEDPQKQAMFESLGFGAAGNGEEFDLDGRKVASVRLERSRRTTAGR